MTYKEVCLFHYDRNACTVLYLHDAVFGCVPTPFDCYLANRGIRTLSVRMKQHEQNALAVAAYLEQSQHVFSLSYPGILDSLISNIGILLNTGLESHCDHKVIEKQCTGYSGMISFKIKGGLKRAKAFLSHIKIFTCATSLGDVESLAALW